MGGIVGGFIEGNKQIDPFSMITGWTIVLHANVISIQMMAWIMFKMLLKNAESGFWWLHLFCIANNKFLLNI